MTSGAGVAFPCLSPLPWSLAGTVMHGYVATLTNHGMLEPLKRRLSPETLRIVEHPPLAICFFNGAALDELLTALHDVSNDEFVRQVAYETCQHSFGRILRPLIQGYLILAGKSPVSIFDNIETIAAPLIRDVRFAYEPTARNGGVLELTFPTQPPYATLVAWEGIARFCCDLAGCAPEVRGHEQLRDGVRALIPVRWFSP